MNDGTYFSNNDDDDIDDNDDLEGEEAVENDSLNDTNSHTTIDDDELMNSYTASIGNHDNEAAEYITDDVGLNDQLFPVKKSEKQVTFQDVVEISTIYSIVNESVESVSYTSEVDDAIDEEFLCDNECNGRKDYKGIKYTEDQLNELERHSNADQCSSEKDLLTVSSTAVFCIVSVIITIIINVMLVKSTVYDRIVKSLKFPPC
ncbi:unnamed protein product [Trichobilharzia regenti]|nr:unnamed protein product [Trichobilharzia regenti]